jgi:transcriptional regulator with GAF, ATPase, and Fis domain
MKRILFALHVPADRALRARFLKGVAANDPLHDLVISLDKPHLVTQLLQKPQSVWFNRGNAARFLPLLPEILLKQSGQESFCLMSIFVGSKPVGVIYADRHGADDITDDHYQHFKQICILTGKALGAKPASRP